MSDYREFYALTLYQRQCLSATNFWRVRARDPPIAIPSSEVLSCIMGCGSVAEINPRSVIPALVSHPNQQYKDFKIVEKPVIRHKSRAFSMYEHLEEL